MINSRYWEHEGANKNFTHEMNPAWLKDVPLDSWVLDFGCGYGRVSKQLYEMGYTKTIGYDPSRSMISRAAQENPGPAYTFRKEDILNQKYSLVVCFALFTSCPEPENQMEIKNIIEKQTARQAFLYISDYLTAENAHYTARYEQNKLGIYGCFGSKDTAVFRHHAPDHFSQLFSAWEQLSKETRAGKTLNGNEINISQLFYKKGSPVLGGQCHVG